MEKLNSLQINSEPTVSTPPRDLRLMELLSKAYTNQIPCRNGLVMVDKIIPFSGYKPTVTDGYRNNFLSRIERNEPPLLYVYQEDDHFVMSDDYIAYSLYLETDVDAVPCVIVGDHKQDQVDLYFGDAYYLPKPGSQLAS